MGDCAAITATNFRMLCHPHPKTSCPGLHDPVAKISMLPMQEAQVQSLIVRTRFHKPQLKSPESQLKILSCHRAARKKRNPVPSSSHSLPFLPSPWAPAIHFLVPSIFLFWTYHIHGIIQQLGPLVTGFSTLSVLLKALHAVA